MVNTIFATGEVGGVSADTANGCQSTTQRKNQAGRDYALVVLRDLGASGFAGGLLHRAEEIEDTDVRAGFFAIIAELALAALDRSTGLESPPFRV